MTSTATSSPSEPVRSLEDQLALEPAGGGAFTTVATSRERRVFGGMLIAQALRAAQVTVRPGRNPHSLHASFVLPADGRRKIRYEVERTRDGGSFATRRVVGRQDDGVVVLLTASFHDDEEGPDYEPPPGRRVPPPDDLPTGRYAGPWFDSRDVPVDAGSPSTGHARRAWFRSRVRLPDDPVLHTHALAYLSDHGLTRAIREPHAGHPGVERRMSVSLDHSLWIHRQARVDTWLLTELTPLATRGGRGLAAGTIRTEDGALVATVAQEALLRLPT